MENIVLSVFTSSSPVHISCSDSVMDDPVGCDLPPSATIGDFVDVFMAELLMPEILPDWPSTTDDCSSEISQDTASPEPLTPVLPPPTQVEHHEHSTIKSLRVIVPKKEKRRRRPSLQYCEICKRDFVRLRVHMARHAAVKPYACKACDKSFTQLCNLRRHYTAFHEKDREKYPCGICHKVLTRKDKLKEHKCERKRKPKKKKGSLAARVPPIED